MATYNKRGYKSSTSKEETSKENEFEEYHYKVLTVAQNKAEVIKKAKATSFYKHCGFKGATSHIDDKYGVDVDDIHTTSSRADLIAK